MYKDFVKKHTKGKIFLINIGDYDLYVKEDDPGFELTIIKHENIVGWKSEPSTKWLDNKEYLILQEYIQAYDTVSTTDEAADIYFQIRDLIGIY